MRSHQKRLDKVAQRIESTPATTSTVNRALEQFRETGELPEHQDLAKHTIEAALRLPRPKSIRTMLFHEALSDSQIVRRGARTALKLLVAIGQDIASRNLVDEDSELSKFGSVGMQLLGWPECLITPPYEDQARRVLQRLAAMQNRGNRTETWFSTLASTAAEFFRGGDLPNNDSMREAVLIYGEVLALGRQVGNQADAEVLQAFDDAAQGEGAESSAAVARLQELACAGRIP